MTSYPTSIRGTVLIALLLFAVALAGALIVRAEGLSDSGRAHVLGAASVLDDPDSGGQASRAHFPPDVQIYAPY
jgi:hypothetical protein